MNTDINIKLAREWFARDVGEVAPVLHNNAIIDAFAAVPREHYLGDGPWGVHSRLCTGEVHQTATASPLHLCHDVLISIDQHKGLNNGLPSLWARVYDNLDLKAGNTVFQVGAGVGYYTAILAELVSPNGRVIAYEIEPDLAERARTNLRHYPNVEVVSGDATKAQYMPEFDVLTACAGATHVPPRWLESLRQGGQLVLPFAGYDGWGFLLHLTKGPDCLPVKSLGPVSFYHCAGARHDSEAEAISAALKACGGGEPPIACYHPGTVPAAAENVWVAGRTYWISSR